MIEQKRHVKIKLTFYYTSCMVTAIVFDFFDVIRTTSGALDAQVLALIAKLHERYKIGMLSNTSAEYVRGLLREHDIDKYFDAIVISREVGMIKPDPSIFEHMLTNLGTQASETIFIDDSPRNVAGAEAVGIIGITYKSIDQLKAELTKNSVTWH